MEQSSPVQDRQVQPQKSQFSLARGAIYVLATGTLGFILSRRLEKLPYRVAVTLASAATGGAAELAYGLLFHRTKAVPEQTKDSGSRETNLASTTNSATQSSTSVALSNSTETTGPSSTDSADTSSTDASTHSSTNSAPAGREGSAASTETTGPSSTDSADSSSTDASTHSSTNRAPAGREGSAASKEPTDLSATDSADPSTESSTNSAPTIEATGPSSTASADPSSTKRVSSQQQEQKAPTSIAIHKTEETQHDKPPILKAYMIQGMDPSNASRIGLDMRFKFLESGLKGGDQRPVAINPAKDFYVNFKLEQEKGCDLSDVKAALKPFYDSSWGIGAYFLPSSLFTEKVRTSGKLVIYLDETQIELGFGKQRVLCDPRNPAVSTLGVWLGTAKSLQKRGGVKPYLFPQDVPPQGDQLVNGKQLSHPQKVIFEKRPGSPDTFRVATLEEVAPRPVTVWAEAAVLVPPEGAAEELRVSQKKRPDEFSVVIDSQAIQPADLRLYLDGPWLHLFCKRPTKKGKFLTHCVRLPEGASAEDLQVSSSRGQLSIKVPLKEKAEPGPSKIEKSAPVATPKSAKQAATLRAHATPLMAYEQVVTKDDKPFSTYSPSILADHENRPLAIDEKGHFYVGLQLWRVSGCDLANVTAVLDPIYDSATETVYLPSSLFTEEVYQSGKLLFHAKGTPIELQFDRAFDPKELRHRNHPPLGPWLKQRLANGRLLHRPRQLFLNREGRVDKEKTQPLKAEVAPASLGGGVPVPPSSEPQEPLRFDRFLTKRRKRLVSDVPGLTKPSDLKMHVDGQRLHFFYARPLYQMGSGERAEYFTRCVKLPEGANLMGMSVCISKGVLEIVLPLEGERSQGPKEAAR